MNGCEYKHNDSVMNYCIRERDCGYQDRTMVKQIMESLPTEHNYYHFPRCNLPNTNKSAIKTADDVKNQRAEQVLKYVADNGIHDLCYPPSGIDALVRN